MTSLLTDTFQQFGYAINNLDILLEDGDLIDDRVATLIQDGTGLSWTYDDPNDMLTGNVSLAPFNTGNLSEGSNLYYTDERVDDRVSSLIQDGTGLSWTYDDGAGALTGDVSLTPFSTSDLSEGSNLYFTNERVDDRVNALIQNGTGLSWTYDDGANTLTGDVSLSSFDTDDLSEGASNLYYTDARVDARLDTNQTISEIWTFQNRISIHQSDGTAKDYLWARDSTDAVDLVLHYNGSAYELRTESNGAGNFVMRFNTNGSVNLGSGSTVNGNAIWHAGNDGPSSGLDADTVDGYEGSELAVLAENNTFTGITNLNGSGLIYSFNDSGIDGSRWLIYLQRADASNGGVAVSSYLQGEIGADQYLIHNRITGTSSTNNLNDWAWTFFGSNEFLISQQGILVGEPTGGKQGSGTINSQQSYNNGNATLDTSDLAENSPGGGIAQTNVSETILDPWNFTGGLSANGNSVLDESDRIENGGNLPKIMSGSLTTISLGIGSSVEETVNHGLGTDNVFAIVRLLGSDGSDGHEVHGVSITPDGLRSHFHAGGGSSTIGLGLGSTPSSGNINLLIRNGSGTTSQTVTVDYTIIAA